MKKIPFIVVYVAILTTIMYCNTGIPHLEDKADNVKQSVTFKSGEIIYPSYACPDTLIVTDGQRLTTEMNLLIADQERGSDFDIDSVLHLAAVKYHINSGLQPINFDSETNKIN